MRADRVPRILHASLAVTDLDSSLAFYQAAFGARVVLLERGMSDMIERTTGMPGVTCDIAQLSFPGGSALLELIAFHGVPAGRANHAPVRPGHGHVCLGVTDFEDAVARAQRHGAALIGEIVAYPEGRAVYLRAPGSSVLELEEVAD